ncbi:MAG: YdhR family protein [candidate division Zixibacteria bacterium]|nr:YdhR family protein [candidate division Zixibacteria bacterium]
MSGKILQLNFKFNVISAEYKQAVAPLADKFAAVDGLVWKIWLMNETESEAGGIYFFKDESSRKAFLEGDLAAAVSNHPALSDMSIKRFDVMDEITAITRGPVQLSKEAHKA